MVKIYRKRGKFYEFSKGLFDGVTEDPTQAANFALDVAKVITDKDSSCSYANGAFLKSKDGKYITYISENTFQISTTSVSAYEIDDVYAIKSSVEEFLQQEVEIILTYVEQTV